MADGGLHEKAKLALKEALDRLLAMLTMRDGWLQLGLVQYSAINSMATALAKYERWRSHIGFDEFYEVLSAILRRYRSESPDESVSLQKALGDKFGAYSAEVWDFLLSLPRAYLVKVDLPAMPSWGPGTISLTDRMMLVEDAPPPPGDRKTNLATLAAALAGSSSEPPSAVRLDVRSSGYGSRRLATTAFQDAISHIKQFFELFRESALFKQTSPSLLELLGRPKPPRFKIIDLARPDEVMEADVPDHLARFLGSVTIDGAKLLTHDPGAGRGLSLLGGGGMREATTREERARAFAGAINDIRELMDCPPDWPDIHNIKTALEWSFDSRENDNQTLSFIQACIGLEALLGDAKDKEEPLTATLADRCAYLLGQSHRDRAGIRERFKEMYRVRSKLVHGRSPKLDIYDLEQLSFAQTTLEEIAREEGRRLRRALRKAKS